MQQPMLPIDAAPLPPPPNLTQNVPQELANIVQNYTQVDNLIRVHTAYLQALRQMHDTLEAQLLNTAQRMQVKRVIVSDGELHFSSKRQTSGITLQFVEQQVNTIFRSNPGIAKYFWQHFMAAHKVQHQTNQPTVTRKFSPNGVAAVVTAAAATNQN